MEKVEKKKKDEGMKLLNIKEATICEATAQMLKKAERDNVETAFHRANTMKACPIGADSACCKHCSMGPCRLNPKDPYSTVGNGRQRGGRPHRPRHEHVGCLPGSRKRQYKRLRYQGSHQARGGRQGSGDRRGRKGHQRYCHRPLSRT